MIMFIIMITIVMSLVGTKPKGFKKHAAQPYQHFGVPPWVPWDSNNRTIIITFKMRKSSASCFQIFTVKTNTVRLSQPWKVTHLMKVVFKCSLIDVPEFQSMTSFNTQSE